MRSRRYTKRVEVWGLVNVTNDYGGNYVTEELLTKSWCEIVTSNALNRSVDFGITDTNETVVFRLRNRKDITYSSINNFFVYREERYIMQGSPVNIGFKDSEIQITLKKRKL